MGAFFLAHLPQGSPFKKFYNLVIFFKKTKVFRSNAERIPEAEFLRSTMATDGEIEILGGYIADAAADVFGRGELQRLSLELSSNTQQDWEPEVYTSIVGIRGKEIEGSFVICAERQFLLDHCDPQPQDDTSDETEHMIADWMSDFSTSVVEGFQKRLLCLGATTEIFSTSFSQSAPSILDTYAGKQDLVPMWFSKNGAKICVQLCFRKGRYLQLRKVESSSFKRSSQDDRPSPTEVIEEGVFSQLNSVEYSVDGTTVLLGFEGGASIQVDLGRLDLREPWSLDLGGASFKVASKGDAIELSMSEIEFLIPLGKPA